MQNTSTAEWIEKSHATAQRFNEYINKMSKTEAIVYIDEQGFRVKRTPTGFITKLSNISILLNKD
jgi:hypothetical protein